MNLPSTPNKKMNYVWLAVCFVLTLPAIFVSLKSSVDLYHEGAIFPSIVGVSNGRAIFTEVNNQYGFVIALISYPAMTLFGNYLLVSRLVGLSVYLLVLLLFFVITKKIANSFIASFGVLILVSINPAWSFLSQKDITGLSVWVNTYGILFSLISIYLVFRMIDNPNISFMVYALAGGISLLSFFVRPQFAFVWLSQGLYLAYHFKTVPFRRSPAKNWFFGGLICFLLGFTYLFNQKVLKDYHQQIFSVWFQSAPNSAHLGLGNVLNFAASCLLFGVCILIVYSVLRLSGSKVISVLFVLLFVKVLENVLKSINELSVINQKIGPYIATAIHGLFFNYASALVLFLVIVLIYSFLSKFDSFSRFSGFRLDGSSIKSNFLFATSLGTLPQLHNVNSAYIYMVIPIVLAWFISYFYDRKVSLLVNKKNLILAVYVTFSILIGISIVNSLILASKPQHPYRSVILQGLNDTNLLERNRIDSNFKVLEMHVKDGQMFMDCQFGLYSISPTGLYVANKWTWNEIPQDWRISSLREANPGNFLLWCGGDKNAQQQYLAWSKNSTISLIEQNNNFLLYEINKPLLFKLD